MDVGSAVRLLLATAGTIALFAASAAAIADDTGLPAELGSGSREISYHKRATMVGAVPYDRAYEQLSPAQRAALRAEYDSVGPNDEPPYPKYGLSDVADAVARMPVREPVEGEVALTVRVDERGNGKSVSIYKTPDRRLSNVVAATLTRIKFKPGLCEGRPCEMDYVFRYHIKVSS